MVVPESIDDPTRPSGGNVYDRRICRGLAAAGWRVEEHAVPGTWPWPDAATAEGLARLVADLPSAAVVLVDGLIASAVPGVLVPQSERLRLVILVHMPLGDGPGGSQVLDARTREGAVLAAARAVVVTSSWTAGRLRTRYGLGPDTVHVAEPGVDAADLASGTVAGGELLCVAAVAAHKGHDLLLAALAATLELPWRCTLVGSLTRDPEFVHRLRQQADADGIGDRVRFSGPRTGEELDGDYRASDLLVLASHAETYGMVVTEALARGLPVIATAVGGLPEALGRTAAGGRPGILVPAGDRLALATALRSWLTDAALRHTLRQAARERRGMLSGWPVTTDRVARALSRAAA